MENFKNTKDRLLSMHARLVEGKMLYKAEEAKRYGCSLRSIQRDIDDLRSFLKSLKMTDLLFIFFAFIIISIRICCKT